MNDKSKDAAAAAEKPSKMRKVTVVAKQTQPRWRAGFQFTTEPTEVEVTEEQLETIKADPLLAVVVPEKKVEAAKA